MDGQLPPRLQVPARRWLACSLPVTAVAWLVLAGRVLASTEGGSNAPENPTLIIAALIGGAIGAIWLLKPAGRARSPRPARSAETSHVSHAHPADGPPEG